MKKKLLLLGATALLSTVAFGFSGTVEVGYEHEFHDPGESNTYSRADHISPYIGFNLRPIAGNSLRTEIKYMYDNEYNLKKSPTPGFKKHRNRLDVAFSGYQYKNSEFTFAPKFGFRVENWRINGNTQNNQDREMVSYRLYPNMSYDINKQVQLYLSGFTGPLTYKTVGKDRSTGKSDAAVVRDRTFTNNWLTEMEVLGIKYKIPGTKHMVGASYYFEQKYVAYKEDHDRHQVRLFGTYTVNDKFTVNPFIRQDIDFDQENLAATKDRGKTRDRKTTRIGLSAAYKLTSATTVGGEFYWNKDAQHSWTNVEVDDRSKWFHKLYVRHAF